MSCREKGKLITTDLLTPPLVLVFSVPSGIVSFIDPVSFRRVGLDTLDGAVVSAAITPGGNRMVIANGVGNRLTVLSLPELEEVTSAALGGAPMDVGMEPAGASRLRHHAQREFLAIYSATGP